MKGHCVLMHDMFMILEATDMEYAVLFPTVFCLDGWLGLRRRMALNLGMGRKKIGFRVGNGDDSLHNKQYVGSC